MVRAQPLESVPAVFHRHVEVQQHQVNDGRCDEVQRLPAVTRGQNDVAFFGQKIAERMPYAVIVVDEKYAWAGNCRGGRSRGGRSCRRGWSRGFSFQRRASAWERIWLFHS